MILKIGPDQPVQLETKYQSGSIKLVKIGKNRELKANPVLPPVWFLKPWYDYTNMTCMTILVIP